MNCLERLLGRMMGTDEKIFEHGFFSRILNSVGDSSRVCKDGPRFEFVEFVPKADLSFTLQNEFEGRELHVFAVACMLREGLAIDQEFRQAALASDAYHV